MAQRLTERRHWDVCYEDLGVSQRPVRRWREMGRRILLRKQYRLLRFLLGGAPERAKVLELGVAPGVMLCQMHDVFPAWEYHGLDYSEVGLRKAQSNLTRRRVKAQLHLGDATSVQLPLQFDLVVSFGLLEHFDEPVEMIKHHARFCRVGGLVAICVPNFAARIPRRVHAYNDPENLAIHNLEIMSPHALESAMNSAGLRRVTTGSSGAPLLHPEAPGKRYANLYRRLARTWNLAWHLSPVDVLWKSTIWGIAEYLNDDPRLGCH